MSSDIKTLKRFVERGYASIVKNDDGSYTVSRTNPTKKKFKWSPTWFWLEVWIGENHRQFGNSGTLTESFDIKPKWLTADRKRSLEEFLIEREVLLL